MRRGGYLERGGRLASSSAKRQAVNVLLPEIRAQLVKRSGGLCEVCRKALGREAAHILPRGSAGGAWAMRNLLWLCVRCHASDRWEYHRGRLVYTLEPNTAAPSYVNWYIIEAADKDAYRKGDYRIRSQGTVFLMERA